MTTPPSQAVAPEDLSRRDFLRLGLGAFGLVSLLQVGAMSLQFLAPRRTDGEFGGLVEVGPATSFPASSVTEFPDGRFFLVRLADGGFLALYRRCTHLGCAVAWHATEAHFNCPCHGSHFAQTGEVVNPPAPRALDGFPITIRNGVLVVDTAEPHQRDRFSPDQLTYV